MIQKLNISFIGGGNMAHSLIHGLIDNGADVSRIKIGEPNHSRRKELSKSFKVEIHEDNLSSIKNSEIIVLAVKPHIVETVITDLTEKISHSKTLVLSIAAGITIQNIESWSRPDIPIIRAMPNTPSLVKAGITALCANSYVTLNQKKKAESIMSAGGTVLWLEDEKLMNIITAISGSGPAYFFYFMESLVQAAILEGIDEKLAKKLVLETTIGAAQLASETQESLSILREKVTSRGGTTEAAIEVFEAYDVNEVIKKAVSAARIRAKNLAIPSGDNYG